MKFALHTLLWLFLLGCSANGNEETTTPNGPPLVLGPVASSCTVGELWVEFNIVITATFKRGEYQVTDPIHWQIDCGNRGCMGTGTRVWSQEGNRIDSFVIQDAHIVSRKGLKAVVQWHNDIFVVNAYDGTVTYTGDAGTPLNGHGSAKCDDYGAPRTSLQPARQDLTS